MIQNQKIIFRSDIDDEAKWHVWGRQISYETLLENDISDHDWDAFMQEAFVFKIDNMRDGLDFIFKIEKTPEIITDYGPILIYTGKRNKVHLEHCGYCDPDGFYFWAPCFDYWEEVLEAYPNAQPCKICRPDLVRAEEKAIEILL